MPANAPPSTSLQVAGWLVILVFGSVMFVPKEFEVFAGLGLLAALWMMPERSSELLRISRDPLFLCTLALLCYMSLSVNWSERTDWTRHVQAWGRTLLLSCFLLAISASLLRIPEFELRLIRFVMLATAIVAILCLLLFAINTPEDGRMQGLFRFNNTGRAGRIFGAMLPICFAGVLVFSGRWRIAALVSLAAGIIAVYATDTRAAWVGGSLGLCCFVIAVWQRTALRFTLFFVALGLVALLGFFYGYRNVPGFASLFFPRGDSFRLGIWYAYYTDIMEQARWIGWGIATEHYTQIKHHSFRGAHNMYLSVMGMIGIPGLLLFLTTLGWSGVRLVRSIELPVSRLGLSLLVTGATAFLVSGDRLIDKVGFVWFVFWLPIAMAIAVRPYLKRPIIT